MNIFAGKQKAWLAAGGAFVASLVIKVSTGGDVGEMATDQTTIDLANLAADAAQSGIVGAVTWVAAYWKANAAADGTEAKFVRPSGVVVDTHGTPVGKVG